MELRVIGRGALAGLIAGIVGFVFARIFAEPVIQAAIDYESSRDDIINALRQAAGMSTEPDGPEIFSRGIQRSFGLFTAVTGVSIAFGLLVAVAFLLLQGKFKISPRALAYSIAGFGLLGMFVVPFAKYPSNPPAIGHTFTIQMRGVLYLTTVIVSLVLLGATVWFARRLHQKYSWPVSVVLAGVAFLVVYGIYMGLMPSLGNLSANVAAQHEFGFARAATETPQPITNVLGKSLTVDGITYAPGQIVYPGFPADLLWKFRWYSLLNQTLIWTVIGLVFGALSQRLLVSKPEHEAATETASQPVA